MTMLDGPNVNRTARTVIPFVLDFGEAVTLPTAAGAAAGQQQVRVAFFAEDAGAEDVAAAPATVWSGVTLADGIAASSSSSSSNGTANATATAAIAAAAASGIAVARTGPGTFSVNVTVPTATAGALTRVAFHI
jgi:hypothetical protein